MKMFSVLGLVVLAPLSTQAYAQDHAPLRLVQTISMPGKEVARVPVGASCDDVYYDAERKRI